ncbi:MAG: hypothetical protein GX136_07230 [Clostridiales bacterium]|nr:hypothetical protein [Clostridiales bacterium]
MKSEWRRVENTVPPQSEIKEDAGSAGYGADDIPASRHAKPRQNQTEIRPENGAAEAVSSLRYTPGGRRRGVNRLAAPIGLLVLALAAVGLISLILWSIKAIERARDDTPLRNELNEFLMPVMQYKPEAFESVNQSKQDALLLAAIWRVTEAERIRQLRDNDGLGSYQLDDLGRMMIPISEIEASYKYLYGPEVTIYHHTIGDEGKFFTFEFDKESGFYHVPSNTATSIYVPVIDTLKKKGDKITVRVGYVHMTKIGRDDKGELVEPTAEMADEFQLYIVQRVGKDSWKLVSIRNESTGKSGQTTTEVHGYDEEDVESSDVEGADSSDVSGSSGGTTATSSKEQE